MKSLKTIVLFFAFIFMYLWVHRGYKIGEHQYNEEKKRRIAGKVARLYKPDNNKFVIIIFYDSTEYSTSSQKAQDIVQVGDSIYKAPNTLKFIVYHNCVLSDTAVFIDENIIYEDNQLDKVK